MRFLFSPCYRCQFVGTANEVKEHLDSCKFESMKVRFVDIYVEFNVGILSLELAVHVGQSHI